jgi:glutamine synthetase
LKPRPETDWIRLEFLDYSNIMRARELRPNYFSKVSSRGINFSKAMMDFTVFEDMVPAPAWGPETGDFFAKPAPETFAPLAYLPHTARIYCDLVQEDGTPWEGCPRYLLKKITEKWEKEFGISFMVAFEAESYLVNKTAATSAGANYSPADMSKCFSPDGLEIQDSVLLDVQRSLEAANVNVEKVTAEYGPGQYEVNFEPSSPLKATDDFVIYREIWRGVARKHGLVATFMPKPFENYAGSGLHLHFSAKKKTSRGKSSKSSESADLFYEVTGKRLGKTGLWFIGGLLRHAKAISAFGNPTINSYKRLQPGSWAPSPITFGRGNRNSLVRLPDASNRIEFRSPDSTSNPYLLLAVVLLAGYDGVKRKIEPPEPVSDDPGHLSTKELHERNISSLPRSLGEAIEALTDDSILRNLIGRLLCQEFIKLREAEWNSYSKQVTPWELETYLETY